MAQSSGDFFLTFFVAAGFFESIRQIAMGKGTKFSIREGGRTVGAGTVAEILK